MPLAKLTLRRDGRARSRTIAPRRLTREELSLGALLDDEYDRPKTRAECVGAPRPCPWTSCRHHLALDVNPETGSIKLNFPHLEVWDMLETCSLDVADRGGMTLEEVGTIMNLTRERIRQVEVRGLLKLKMAFPGDLAADLDSERASRRSRAARPDDNGDPDESPSDDPSGG